MSDVNFQNAHVPSVADPYRFSRGRAEGRGGRGHKELTKNRWEGEGGGGRPRPRTKRCDSLLNSCLRSVFPKSLFRPYPCHFFFFFLQFTCQF